MLAAILTFLEVLALSRTDRTVATYCSGLKRFTEWLESIGLPPATTLTTDLPADTLERFAVAVKNRYPGRKSTLWAYASAARAFYRFLYARRIGPRASTYELNELRLKEVMGRFEYRTPRIDRRLSEVVKHVLSLSAPSFAHSVIRPRGKPPSWKPNRKTIRRGEIGLRKRREWLRDRALFLTLWTTGARVSEIVGLNRDDVDDGRADQALITGRLFWLFKSAQPPILRVAPL